MARDRENDFRLIAIDWVPIHFWGQEIQKNTEKCVEAIEDLIFELQMMLDTGCLCARVPFAIELRYWYLSL